MANIFISESVGQVQSNHQVSSPFLNKSRTDWPGDTNDGISGAWIVSSDSEWKSENLSGNEPPLIPSEILAPPNFTCPDPDPEVEDVDEVNDNWSSYL